MKELCVGMLFFLVSCFCVSAHGQDCGRHMPNKMKFKVVKPASVVKSAVTFTTKSGKRILCSVKKVVSVPFRDVEFETFEYTFPKLEWNKGILKRLPQPPTDEELKEYYLPLHIVDPRDTLIL